MPSDNYRYYRLDSAGHLHDPEWIEAKSDKDAIAQVRAMHRNVTWELWLGTRRVEKLSTSLHWLMIPTAINWAIIGTLATAHLELMDRRQ